jgi:hypothetical protein
MSKVLSAVFGIGIAVVVYVTLLLGIQAFYPAPKYENFCSTEVRYAEPVSGYDSCTDNMTMLECRKQIDKKGVNTDEVAKCNEDFRLADEVYGRNFFIAASILGTIALVAAFYLFLSVVGMTVTNITAGIACSGIVMIAWAFIRGWEGTDDKLKFMVGLIIAVIIITLTIMLNKKTEKK